MIYEIKKATFSGLLFLISVIVRVLIALNMRMHRDLWPAIFCTNHSVDIAGNILTDLILNVKEVGLCYSPFKRLAPGLLIRITLDQLNVHTYFILQELHPACDNIIEPHRDP